MADDQRTHLLEAMALWMAARRTGPEGISAKELSAAAGVARAQASELLADPQAALEEIFELALSRARRAALAADSAESRWLDRARAVVAALLRFCEQETGLLRALLLGGAGGTERTRRSRDRALGECREFLEQGLNERFGSDGPLVEALAENLLGGAVATLTAGLQAEPARAASDLHGSVMAAIALAQLGPAGARREFARPFPAAPSPISRSPGGGARRLTYRTQRVLEAIAQHPGSSNREVAERGGIADQGQVSKLLARLERKGLVAKAGGHGRRGAPNCWQLTEDGLREVGTEELPAEVSRRP